jgi:hypothetical protein
MDINRYLAGLLLFCFSAFLGHNLVPHQHISEILYSPIATACPFEHGDQPGHHQPGNEDANQDRHSTHCHAFNDVVFEKFSPSVYHPRTDQLQVTMVPGQALAPEIPILITASPVTFFKQDCRSFTDKGPRALRAPPVFG